MILFRLVGDTVGGGDASLADQTRQHDNCQNVGQHPNKLMRDVNRTCEL